jgi:hypothetical protein
LLFFSLPLVHPFQIITASSPVRLLRAPSCPLRCPRRRHGRHRACRAEKAPRVQLLPPCRGFARAANDAPVGRCLEAARCCRRRRDEEAVTPSPRAAAETASAAKAMTWGRAQAVAEAPRVQAARERGPCGGRRGVWWSCVAARWPSPLVCRRRPSHRASVAPALGGGGAAWALPVAPPKNTNGKA